MFSVGDKIVYPLYGAGVIEDLEQLEVDGASQTYYVMFIPTGNLKIKVPAKKAEYVGIREVYEKEKVIGIMRSIMDKPIDMPENWNLRYKENLEKIKSGNLFEVAVVFRNLLYREREKGLSSAEKKMLSTSKQIIISELILTQDVDRSGAEQLLSEYVG
ncbi:MAG: CarD family transcriptional regulator [Clostridiales bacterium]|nr:CarD family transcriptional regulator [Clostridiales bacterium]